MKSVRSNIYNKWIIVFACSIINMLNATTRIVPLFFVASIDRYGVNRVEASFPYSLRLLVEAISAPIVGYLGCQFGLRPVVVLGGIIASIGIGVCFFANDVILISVFYGGVYGFGCSMARKLLPEIITRHFDKGVASAYGIALIGTSIGGFVFPPLFQFIIEMYGLSGSFLILSAIFLHAIPAGMILRTPKSTKKSISEQTYENTDRNKVSDKTKPKYEIKNYSVTSGVILNPSSLAMDKSSTEGELKEKFSKEDFNPIKNINLLSKEVKAEYVMMTNEEGVDNFVSNKDHDTNFDLKRTASFHENDNKINSDFEKGEGANFQIDFEFPKPLLEGENLNTSHNQISRKTHSNVLHESRECIRRNDAADQNRVRLENTHTKSADSKILPKCSKNVTMKHRIFEIFGMLCDPLFILISITQSLFCVTLYTFLTIFVDFARDIEIPRLQAVYILMCFSISDMVGRLGLGWITDKGFMTITNFSAFCYVGFGVLFSAMTMSSNFVLIMIVTLIMGLVIGGQSIILPGIVAKYFKGDKKTFAMAARLYLFGPLSQTIPPLIGFFRTGLGSYRGLIYLVTSASLFCGIILFLMPSFVRYMDRKKNTAKEKNPIPDKQIEILI